MRIDITQIIKVCVMNGIKPNYSKIARQFNVIQELLSINFPEFDTYIVQNLYFQRFERFYTVVYTDFIIS